MLGFGAISQLPLSTLPGATSPDVTVALSGVSATGQTGTLKPSFSIPVTGVSGTGAVGSLLASFGLSATGVAGTGQVGTLGVDFKIPITGVEATGAIGTLSVANGDITLALTGVSATTGLGTLSPAFSIPLTGVAATGQLGLLAPTVAPSLTGVSGTGQTGTVSPAFSIPITGVAGTGQLGTLVVPGDVTVALTGVSATAQLGNLTPNIDQATTGGGVPHWNPYRPTGETEEQKRARREAQGIIQRAKQPKADIQELFKEAATVSTFLKSDIERLEKQAVEYQALIDQRRTKARAEALAIARNDALATRQLQAQLIEIQLMAERQAQQIEELDVVFMAVMLAAL